ncbi:hypothetical protein KAFR_0E02410 [Kazachstania africana CBS 2517]|uniref:Zn(2)-C6 fungal-type domain-containing protein n=1 Tax=Kazachstania africana (strain ATCC 22294 / BCRC 22015 / CBS 2517 / CECT 1963 / NBRC 1671 / NRRL Y-8276) TaxID=1071382 RepID=H2AVJ4_KAZAF|nr:hypothetical protein KAFR_0E02410 [Kazachstania africana CBS 2517]CCF58394.1 hypothetical protein KAFR_0E02410 [Kazachstania africana CBS 2517]
MRPDGISFSEPSPSPSTGQITSQSRANSNKVQGTNDNGNAGKKRLACNNCRKRRKKCNLAYPCDGCVRLKLKCNINEEDLRRKRYTNAYVKSLEEHITQLEMNLKSLAGQVYPNNSHVLKDKTYLPSLPLANNEKKIDSPLAPILPPLGSQLGPSIIRDAGSITLSKKKVFLKGSLYPEGPVTYKSNSSISQLPSASPSASIGSADGSSVSLISNADGFEAEKRIADLKTTVIKRPTIVTDPNLIINDAKILKALSNFYKWLYPGHFTFVHRESFLYGFFNHAKNNYEDSNYCSVELIYAMCAVGSRLSPDLQNMSEIYYEKSKMMLLNLVFDEDSISRITTVQALLCLAFYELGRGSYQLAWYFSGLAMRVGHDMGFQLDPKDWYTDESSGKLTKSELEIRSRIYWGCYIADHFICLMLGRTATLSVSNSTIPESDELPEVEGTEEFRFVGKHVLQISLPLKNLIILSRFVQIFTSKIFIESDDTIEKVKYLNKFNGQVYNWRQSLPDLLKWSKELLEDDDVSTDPTISYFWYYYYIVRLTFNRPFMKDSDEARIVIVEIIDDLKKLFENFKRKFGSYKKATIFQLYACILTITCLKKLQDMKVNSTAELQKCNDQLKFFEHIFNKELYPAYDLPKRLNDDEYFEIDTEKQALNQVANNNYTHDFSLSNEIDDLIKDIFGVDYNPAQPLI